MKKSNTALVAAFLAIILPLVFLAVNFFLNRNNPDHAKISWEQPKEEPKDNFILAPAESGEPIAEDFPKESKKPAEKPPEPIPAVSLDIKNHLADWGFEKAAQRNVDTVIIHSSYDALSGNPYSVEGLIQEYRQYGVAPHYLIDRKGTIYRLVEEKNIAYHAGISQVPDGRKNVNEFSLGIEIMTTKKDSPTKEQYTALQKLVDFLKKSYRIKYILGHDQIAAGRKDDPWNFNWESIKK